MLLYKTTVGAFRSNSKVGISLCHALKLADSGVSAVADERFSASFSFSSVDDERFSAFSHFHSWMMNVFSYFLAFIRG